MDALIPERDDSGLKLSDSQCDEIDRSLISEFDEPGLQIDKPERRKR
jgi:hypothetical protein